MLPEKIIFVGVLINLIASLWYVKNIIYGNTRPNLVSYFIWMLAPFIGVFLQVKAGANLSTLSVFMAGFGPLLVLLFSICKRNAYWKITTFDMICGTFSIIALIFYIFTHKLGISILFAIVSDCLAAIPTVRKSWNFPETETSTIYIAGFLSNIFSLLIIKNWIFSVYAFSIYLIVINTIIVFAIYHKKIFKKVISA